jgi:hypothetical protein
MDLTDALNDLGAMNTRQHFIRQTWEILGDGLSELVKLWQNADVELRAQFLEYQFNLSPTIVQSDEQIVVRVKHGSATFRLNDPLGHLSVIFARETSFGLSHILMLYSIDVDEHGAEKLIRIDDQNVSSSAVEELLNATRMNLLQPKVLPARVGAAMAAMNASATSI